MARAYGTDNLNKKFETELFALLPSEGDFICESSMTGKFTSFSLNKGFVNWKVVLSFNISFCDIDMLVDDGSTSPRGFNLQTNSCLYWPLLQWRRESVACWNKTGHILRYSCGINSFFHCWVH